MIHEIQITIENDQVMTHFSTIEKVKIKIQEKEQIIQWKINSKGKNKQKQVTLWLVDL